MRPTSIWTLVTLLPAFSLMGCNGNVEVGDPGGTAGKGGSGGSGSSNGSGASNGSTGSTGPGQGCSGTKLLADGVFFFVIDVETPIATQIQLFGDVRVKPETGVVIGQLTNANRPTEDPNCPIECSATEACRTIPTVECVPPSTKADSTDEYPDFAVAAEAPQGYSFTVNGCAEDEPDGTTLLTTNPTTFSIQSPSVTFEGLTIECSFAVGADGVLRCEGEMKAAQVLLGSQGSGPSKGPMRGRLIPAGEEPEGLPAPPL
ncbi:MAG: hypothetical protein IPK82_29605 [Polyangiaceae bacterium]|nr:hypothetical protein [Polyangiaceae bacterium]